MHVTTLHVVRGKGVRLQVPPRKFRKMVQFFRRKFILHKETNLQKNYIHILQNLYTHTMEMHT